MRRVFMVAVVLLAVSAMGSTIAGAQGPDDALVDRARELLREVPLIDGHNDTPWQYRQRVHNHLDRLDLADTAELNPRMHTDIRRLRQGGVGAQFWSVYIPATLTGGEGVRAVVEQIDIAKRMIEKYGEDLELALTADDIQRIHRQGKIASLLGMEGGHSIGNSLAALRATYALGARYMTVTHSLNTPWADSATDEPASDGLSAFGEEVIREMNRLGMLIDLSHVHPLTMHDAIDVSEAPVIFSHSSARAVTDHPRNVPDDVLRRLPEKDGIVMVTFLSNYVSQPFSNYVSMMRAERERLRTLYPEDDARVDDEMEKYRDTHRAPPNASLSDLADHFDHIRDTVGVDYLGIGSDYDGTTFLADEMDDVSTFPVLLAELLRRGYSEHDIKKIAGLNLLRVMRKAELVAARLKGERPPSDARIEELDGDAGAL